MRSCLRSTAQRSIIYISLKVRLSCVLVASVTQVGCHWGEVPESSWGFTRDVASFWWFPKQSRCSRSAASGKADPPRQVWGGART